MTSALVDWSLAIVEPRKLTDYLLSLDHPYGASKARFFLACGFSPHGHEAFAQALIAQARGGLERTEAGFDGGTKLIVDGETETPAGDLRRIRTVWMLDSARARLVSAYPLRSEAGDT